MIILPYGQVIRRKETLDRFEDFLEKFHHPLTSLIFNQEDQK